MCFCKIYLRFKKNVVLYNHSKGGDNMIPTEAKHTIKDLRVRAGLSQNEAATKLGVTAPTLRKWEI